MWNLPGPGIEPVSPALAGGSLTTGSPGKPCVMLSCLTQQPHDLRVSGHLEDRNQGAKLGSDCLGSDPIDLFIVSILVLQVT